jgi:hypothetical protein
LLQRHAIPVRTRDHLAVLSFRASGG